MSVIFAIVLMFVRELVATTLNCEDVAQTYASITYNFAFVVNCNPGTISQSGSCTNAYCPAGFKPTDKQCVHSGLTVPICEAATSAFEILPSLSTAAAGDYVLISLIARMSDGSVSSSEYRDVYLVYRSSSLGVVKQQVTMTAGLGVFSPGVRSTQVETISLALEPVGGTISSSVLASAAASISIKAAAGALIQYVTSEISRVYVGVTQTIQWKIYDQFGNFAVTDSRSCVRTLSTTDSSKLTCSPSCSSTAVSVVNGIGSFTVKSVKSQTVTVGIACGSLSFTGGSYFSLSVAFDPQSATTVAFASSSSSTTTVAGTYQTLVIQAYDIYGNLATGFTSTITVSSSTCTAAMGTKSVSIASGTGSVDFSNNVAQTCLFRIVTGVGSIQFVGSQASLKWTPAAAYKIFITAPASNTALSADAAVTLEARVEDSFGNIKDDDINSRPGTLTLTPAGQSAVVKVVSFTNGRLSYSLKWNSLGSVSAVVSSVSLLSSPAISLVYSFGSAKSVEFESPANALSSKAGTLVNIGLVVRDAYGNVVTTSNGNLATVKSSAGTFTPSATPTFTLGRASVSFTATTAGSVTLSLGKGSTSSSLVYPATLALTFTPGDATAVRLSTAGTSFVVGTTVSVSVSVEDAYGNSLAGVAGADFAGGSVARAGAGGSQQLGVSMQSGTATVSFVQTVSGSVKLTWSQGSSSLATSRNSVTLTFSPSAVADVTYAMSSGNTVPADQIASFVSSGIDAYNNVVLLSAIQPVTVVNGPCVVKQVSLTASGGLLVQVTAGLFVVWPLQVCEFQLATFSTLASVTFRPGSVSAVMLQQTLPSSTVSISQTITALLVDKFGNKVQGTAITQTYSVCFGNEKGLSLVGSNCVVFGSSNEASLVVVSNAPGIFSVFITSTKPSLSLFAPFGVTFVAVKQADCSSLTCFIVLSLTDVRDMTSKVGQDASLVVSVLDKWGNYVVDFAGTAQISIDSGSGTLTGGLTQADCQLVAGLCRTYSVSNTQSGTSASLIVSYAGSDASVAGDPVIVNFTFGTLNTYQFSISTLSQSVEESALVTLVAVDQFGNTVTTAQGSVQIYPISGKGGSSTTVNFIAGVAEADLRNRVANTVVYKLRNGSGVDDVSLTSLLAFEYLPGEAFDWIIDGPIISPLNVNSEYTVTVVDQYRNALDALYTQATYVRVTVTENPSGTATDSVLDLTLISGSASFQLQYSVDTEVRLTPLGFLETPFFAVFRSKVTSPDFTATLVKGSLTSSSAQVDLLTSEAALVTCVALKADALHRLDNDDAWLTVLMTYGSFIETHQSHFGSAQLPQYARVSVDNLLADSQYFILCAAKDLLTPPNVTPHSQSYTRLIEVFTLYSSTESNTKALFLGLVIGIPALILLAVLAVIYVRRNNQRSLLAMAQAHDKVVKMLVDGDDGTSDDDAHLDHVMGDSSDILQEAERMQKEILGKIKNADKPVNQAPADEPSEEPEELNPKRALSEVENLLNVWKDRRLSVADSVESGELSSADVSIEKILSFTGVGHLMFEFTKLLKDLVTCNSDGEVSAIKTQWAKLMDGVATRHLPLQELDQLNSLFGFIAQNAVAERIKILTRQENVKEQMRTLSVETFPCELADFIEASRKELQDLEDDLSFHSRAAFESFATQHQEESEARTTLFKRKYEEASNDDEKSRILRDVSRAIHAHDDEVAEAKQASMERLLQERQARLSHLQQKQQAELQQLVYSQRQRMQELAGSLHAGLTQANDHAAEMERSIDSQMIPGWSIVVERELVAREDDRKLRRLADVKKYSDRASAKATTEDERSRILEEARKLEDAVVNQHQIDIQTLKREVEFKLKERKERINQVRDKKINDSNLCVQASKQLAESKANATTQISLRKLEMCLQNQFTLIDANFSANVEADVALGALRESVTAEISPHLISADDKATDMQRRLITAEGQLKDQLAQQLEMQLSLLRRMLARKERDLDKQTERQTQSQLDPYSDAVRTAELQAYKSAQAEANEVNQLLLEDAISVIDREEQQLLTSLSLAGARVGGSVEPSVVEKLQNIVDVSERMKRERAIIAECARRRRLAEAHFLHINAQDHEQLLEDVKTTAKLREIDDQHGNIQTEAIKEIALLNSKTVIDSNVSAGERKQVMEAWAEGEEAQEAQIVEQISQQKADLLARAKERSQKLDAKKQQIMTEREVKKAKSSALLNRAVGALAAHKLLAAQHELELASLKARHKDIEDALKAEAQVEIQKMQDQIKEEQDEKRKIAESKERIKRVADFKSGRIAPEEFGAIKQERDMNVAALSQVIGEEQTVHEKVLQAKLQKRQERLVKKQQAAKLQHTQAEIKMELEIEQAKVKQLEAKGDVDALMEALERVNRLVSRLNESTVAPLKSSRSNRSMMQESKQLDIA